jgi:DNA-binding NarL/FixJ family response regulator
LKALINRQPDMLVIGEAGDGETAWQQARECQPDIVIMDITMPGLNGVLATTRLKRACPQIKVLALSVHDDTSYLRQLLTAGAVGYVLKHAAADDLIQAIRIVAAGGIYLDPALAGHVVARYVQVPGVASALEGTELSERETDVVQRVAHGYSNKEIAAQLNLSVKTVETYRARALDKLGIESRAELVRYALEHGWLHGT